MFGFFRKVAFWRHSNKAPAPEQPTASKDVTGYNGDLDADAVLLFEEDRIILSIDYDFPDVPSYVEFDLGNNHIQVVQQGGDVATLSQLKLPKDEHERLSPITSIALLTGTGARAEKLVQMVSVIVKQPAAPTSPASYSF